MTTDQLYQLYLQHPVISTDTRKISPGCIFFALKGEKFDANTFAKQAIAEGAACAVIDNRAYRSGEQYILVDDTLLALQDLARHHRRQLRIPVIGLTGTNGKTTTKELINAVLSQHFNTYATQGNLNNHIGVPLSILSINSTHQAAVIEMGANHQKEIELLSGISQPSHGLITNVGKAHLEGFGGVEGVKKGKGELYDFLKASGGVAFVNGDDKTLMEMKEQRDMTNVVYYGNKEATSLVSGRIIDNSPLLTLEWTDRYSGKNYEVKTQLTGEYNLPNILAAICIGICFKLSPGEINAGISGYQPKNNRSQIVQTATNTLICDYYNANPSSMAVAIENLGKIEAKHKVLVLGDMFEMGDEAAAEHAAIIRKAMETPVNERIFIGTEFAGQKSEVGSQKSDAVFYPIVEEAIEALKANPIRNATVLIKGSRGMALERLVELF
jgi:UDP-N-acetylmuramoyl-tripeptide--D-alanyl-D-alanine ligase